MDNKKKFVSLDNLNTFLIECDKIFASKNELESMKLEIKELKQIIKELKENKIGK